MAASVVTLLRSATDTATRLSMVLGGINPIFAGIAKGAQSVVKYLAKGVQEAQKYFDQIKKFYSETIKLVQELEAGTRNSAITIASNVDLLTATAGKVTDSAQKIALLMPELKKIQESLITRAPNIVGVTADELLQTFNQVSIQFGQLTGQVKGLEKFGLTTELQAAEELTVRLSSAMKTVGLRQRDIAQEVRAILTGTIDRNARLARQLQITGAQIKAEKAKGTLASFILEKTEASVAANELFNNSIENTLSVLESFQKQFRRSIGEGAFEGFTEGLLKLRKVLEANEEIILEWGSEIGAVIGPAFKNMMTAVSGVVETILASKDQIQPVIKFLLELFFETGEIVASTVSGTIAVLNGLGIAIRFLSDMFVLGFQTIYGVIEVAADTLESISGKVTDFFEELGESSKIAEYSERGFALLADGISLLGDKIRIANGYKLDKVTKELTGFQEVISDTGWLKKTAGAFNTLFRQIPILGDDVRESNQILNKEFIQTADATSNMANTATKSFMEIREAAKNAAPGTDEKKGLVEQYLGSQENIDSLVEQSMEALEEIDAQMKGNFAEFDIDAFQAQLRVFNDIAELRMSQALTEAELLEDFDKQKIEKLEAWKIERASLAIALEKAALNAKDPIQQEKVRKLRKQIEKGDEAVLEIQKEINQEFEKQAEFLATTPKDIERFGASSEASAKQVEEIFENWERGTRTALEVAKEMPKEFKAIELAIKNGGAAQEDLNKMYDEAISEITKIKDVDQREKVVKAIIKLEKELNNIHKEEVKFQESNLKLLEAQGVISSEQLKTAESRLAVSKELQAAMMMIEEFALSQKLNAEENLKLEAVLTKQRELELKRSKNTLALARARTAEEYEAALAKEKRIQLDEIRVLEETIALLGGMDGHTAKLLKTQLETRKTLAETKQIQTVQAEETEKTAEAQRKLNQLLKEQQLELEYIGQLYELVGSSTDEISQNQKNIALGIAESKLAQEAYTKAVEAQLKAEEEYNRTLERRLEDNATEEELNEAKNRLLEAGANTLKQANRQYNSQLNVLKATHSIEGERLERINKIKKAYSKIKISEIDFKLGNLDKFKGFVKTLENAPKNTNSAMKNLLNQSVKKLKPLFKDISEEGIKGVKAQIELVDQKYEEEQKIADLNFQQEQLASQQRIAILQFEQTKQAIAIKTGQVGISGLQEQAKILSSIVDMMVKIGSISEAEGLQIKNELFSASLSAEAVKNEMGGLIEASETAVSDAKEMEEKLADSADSAKDMEDKLRKGRSEFEKMGIIAKGMAEDNEKSADAAERETAAVIKRRRQKPTRTTSTGGNITLNTGETASSLEDGVELGRKRTGGSVNLSLAKLLGADKYEEWQKARSELDTQSLQALEDFKLMVKTEFNKDVSRGRFNMGSWGINFGKIIDEQKNQMKAEANKIISLWNAQKKREEEAIRKQEAIIRKQEEQIRKAEERKAKLEQIREEAKQRRLEARQQAADALTASWEQTRQFLNELRTNQGTGQDIFKILADPEFQKSLGFSESGTEDSVEESQRNLLVERFGEEVADRLAGIVNIDEQLIDQLNKGTAKQEDLITQNKIFLDPETGQIIVTGKDPDFDKLRQLIELQTISNINEQQVDALGRIEGLTADQNDMLFNVFRAINAGRINDQGQVLAFGAAQGEAIDFSDPNWAQNLLNAEGDALELEEEIRQLILNGLIDGTSLADLGDQLQNVGIDESSIRAFGRDVGQVISDNTGAQIDVLQGIADGSFLANNAVAIEATGVEINAETISGLEEMFGEIEGLVNDIPTSQEAITTLSKIPTVNGGGSGSGSGSGRGSGSGSGSGTFQDAFNNINSQLTNLNNQKYENTYLSYNYEYDQASGDAVRRITGATIRELGTGRPVQTVNFNNNTYNSVDQASQDSALSFYQGFL